MKAVSPEILTNILDLLRINCIPPMVHKIPSSLSCHLEILWEPQGLVGAVL